MNTNPNEKFKKLNLNDELNTRYTEQLRKWLDATGKNDNELLELTKEFIFRGKPEEFSSSTLSRTLQERPEGAPRMYRLYAILGALYILGAISDKKTAEDFLISCGLDKVSTGLIWEDIWQTIESVKAKSSPELKVTEPETNTNSTENNLPATYEIDPIETLPQIVNVPEEHLDDNKEEKPKRNLFKRRVLQLAIVSILLFFIII